MNFIYTEKIYILCCFFYAFDFNNYVRSRVRFSVFSGFNTESKFAPRKWLDILMNRRKNLPQKA